MEATRCSACGAALNGVPVTFSRQAGSGSAGRGKKTPLERPAGVSWEDGETDLYEGSLPALSIQAIILGLIMLALIVGGLFFAGNQLAANNPTPTVVTATPNLTLAGIPGGISDATLPPTNTKIMVVQPTLPLATVTPAPPTVTITPTKGPCTQKAVSGDSVYAMAARCGHKHLSIVDLILQLNNMKDPNQLQVGQTLEIPWPTPTGGAPTDGASGASDQQVNFEPTLPSGVMWYTINKGDTAVSVAYSYNTTMKTLRDLNPEIQFLQCDFGQPGGGTSCTLNPMLGEGQKVRVPAPTPTPTLSPTLTGSETATPTATATFNKPVSQLPNNNMQYTSGELPTLRWVGSGQLSPTEVYLVSVHDITADLSYRATTRDLSFQLPAEWQAADGTAHTFEWSIAVASLNDTGTPIPSAYSTEIRNFMWQGR
jgi:LysM repeat protein